MKTIEVRAFAKLNLSLDVTQKRPDGYHDMAMVMQTVSLHDDIRMELTNGEFETRTNLKFIPNDDRNLALRAAKLFFSEAGLSGGVSIDVLKRIPVGSGMGGGSADAAAVLRGLNTLAGRPFSGSELEKMGEMIGSDVPFCVQGGTQLAEGRGEVLTPLKPIPDCYFVICKPEFSISTPQLFKKLDTVQLKCRPDTAGILSAIDEGDLLSLCRRMYNVFEDVPDRRRRAIHSIRQELLDAGAMGAIMTGSGSAVFGVFPDSGSANAVRAALSRSHRAVFLARNILRQTV